LTNNSPDLCVLTLCIKFRQKKLVFSITPKNIMGVIIYRLYLIFPDISGKFPEILNLWKIYNANNNDRPGFITK